MAVTGQQHATMSSHTLPQIPMWRLKRSKHFRGKRHLTPFDLKQSVVKPPCSPADMNALNIHTLFDMIGRPQKSHSQLRHSRRNLSLIITEHGAAQMAKQNVNTSWTDQSRTHRLTDHFTWTSASMLLTERLLWHSWTTVSPVYTWNKPESVE